MNAADVQAAWARLLIDSLVEAGVREAVISPGSRSTPFVLAAAGQPRLRCFDLIDERSAAFFALGQGKVTGRPTLLICTSGSAGAHYLPAVLEARQAHAPLLMLTADRPVELVDCGANQTVDQLKLFGDAPVAFYDLGSAEADPRALRGLRRLAVQAVLRTREPVPGAVHLNARAREPLEPSAEAAAVEPSAATPAARPWVARRRPPETAVTALAGALARARRPLIVCGPAPIAAPGGGDTHAFRRAVLRLARIAGAPLLAETASQLRVRPAAAEDGAEPLVIGAFDVLLRGAEWRRRMAPDLIVQIGRAPTATVWLRYLEAHPDVEHWVIAAHGWHDPTSSASDLLVAEPELALTAVAERLHADRSHAEAWRAAWSEAEARAWRATGEALDDDPEDVLSEGAVARISLETLLAAATGEGALLALGNSLPIRQVDTWFRGGAGDLAVWHQRGTSGIDGLIAGAAGAAIAAGRPTLLLLGDVSFLHDLSGLAAARRVETPYAVVAVDNRGGRIFEQLPVASHRLVDEAALEHWTTPHDADLGHAAAVWGLPHAQCSERAGLHQALAAALRRPGCTVVTARVPRHGAARQNAALYHAVEKAVADLTVEAPL